LYTRQRMEEGKDPKRSPRLDTGRAKRNAVVVLKHGKT